MFWMGEASAAATTTQAPTMKVEKRIFLDD
jgi:hypothetical protein